MLYRPDNDNPRLSITAIHKLNNMLRRNKAPESTPANPWQGEVTPYWFKVNLLYKHWFYL